MRVWLVVVAAFVIGCGGPPAPPVVDAAAEAEDERLIKEAGDRERKSRKAHSKDNANAD